MKTTPFHLNLNFPLHFLVIATLATTGQHLYAAEPGALEEVVVTGSRVETKLSETPQAIGVIKADVVNRDKPKTMGDVINRIPGVYWNDLGNEQHSMAIRQPIGTNALYQYLEDGIPIRPLGVFNHNALNEMNLAGTESVEVVKGPASSLYGSNAVGGAVNFLTAAPTRIPYASFGARHDDTAGFTRYDTAAGNTWGDLGIRFSHYNSHRTANNWQEYSGGSKDSFSLRADYGLNAFSVLRATLVHTDLYTETSGSVPDLVYQNNPGGSLNTFTYRKDVATRATLAWEGETTRNGITTMTFFGRRNNHGQLPNYTIANCVPGTCGTVNNNHVDSLGLDVKHQQEFSWLGSRLITGVHFDKSRNSYVSDNLRITVDPSSGKYVSYTVASASDPRGVRNYQAGIINTALFSQYELSPIPKMRVVLGARADTIRYDFTNKLSPAGSPDFGAANETRSFSHVSPKIGATYALGKDAGLYGNISQGFTPPEVSQLYSKTSIPNLKPATYNNVEIGLRMAFLNGALKLDSALYRLDGRDTIVSYSIAPGNSENRNAGRTRSQGLELGLSWIGDRFDARLGTAIASHRFQDYQISSAINYDGKEMPQAPSDISTAELGWKPLQNARIAVELIHQGAYWMDNANTEKYPGHMLWNLRGTYLIANGWDLYLQARNLTDKRYADFASRSGAQNRYTPGAPRSIMVGLTYTFDAKNRP